MILIAAAALFLNSVDDFYPTSPGSHWVYEDKENSVTIEETAGKPVEIKKGFSAIPITSIIGGKDAGKMFYKASADTIHLVAFQAPGKTEIDLLPEPQPIVKIEDDLNSDWAFQGQLPSALGPVAFYVKGQLRKGPKTTVLGNEVDTVKAVITSDVGGGKSATHIRQEAIYARGIGLVEMKETSKSSGSQSKRYLKLVSFDPAK